MKTIQMKNSVRLLVAGVLLLSIGCGEKKEDKKEPLIQRTKTEEPKKEPRQKLSAGAKAFIQCAACHNLKEGQPNKVGPNLYGIFGRKAASLEGFAYSKALQKSDIVWNEDHIRAWLEKPTDYVPGTIMAFIGIQNKEQQDILIEYLKEETK